MDGIQVIMPIGTLLKLLLGVVMVVLVASFVFGAMGTAGVAPEVAVDQLSTSCATT